ncbi:hypothetical protein F4820DRAFT_433760 [Hypoxylon rubiginosum]|uniref:Uncharacterized protein n=1 Tax=Hypoxylon rubiginosum TaxID=110542 RepID=A0ACB9YQG8_9PEZI|nr:hypothetical protein F4820DRAFT_433760 [Hypoxylon rubiginosum]
MHPILAIPTRNVDPARLSNILRNKFGRGGFRIEMRHCTYKVYANYQLTEVKEPIYPPYTYEV